MTAKGSIAVAVSMGAFGSFLSSCNHTLLPGSTMPTAGFGQDPLPYAYSALEPVIDARTMELHYSKHAAGYATKLQEAVNEENVASAKSVETILKNITRYSSKMRNNAGGHYNHDMFWKSMKASSKSNAPQGTLKTAIENSFTSVDQFKTAFNEAATTRFGSGWAWLYVDSNKNLKIGSTPNQDNPLMNVSAFQGFPLLGIDVWEHAYYLKYQNKRKEYIENWWNVVNWDYVQKRFDAA